MYASNAALCFRSMNMSAETQSCRRNGECGRPSRLMYRSLKFKNGQTSVRLPEADKLFRREKRLNVESQPSGQSVEQKGRDRVCLQPVPELSQSIARKLRQPHHQSRKCNTGKHRPPRRPPSPCGSRRWRLLCPVTRSIIRRPWGSHAGCACGNKPICLSAETGGEARGNHAEDCKCTRQIPDHRAGPR